MQKLRTTDAISEEILKDCRDQAKAILKQAEEECKKTCKTFETELKNQETEKKQQLQQRINLYEEKKKAGMPLEQQRFRLSFIQSKIEENLNEYILSLTEEQKIAIAARNIEEIEGQTVNAYVYGFDLKKTKAFLLERLGGRLKKCEETSFMKLVPEAQCGLQKPCGMILETEDRQFRLRLTLSEAVGKMLEEKRSELAAALFGEML